MATQPYAYKSVPPKPRFSVTYNIPDKRAPPETTNRIFSAVATGNYFDIKKAIIRERSSLHLHDAQNRSITHYILLNTDISTNDKYTLIKNVIEMGAPVDSSDANGVRPLHLASGQQNKKVVDYLLQKGAEVNSTDSNMMTPLHYAVTVETEVCRQKKTILPERTKEIEFRTDQLFEELFKFMQKDQTTLRYISHLASIFRERLVYTDPDKDRKELNKLIEQITTERGIPDVEQSYAERLVAFKKGIHDKTKNELSRSLQKLDIKENTANGWAPIINPDTMPKKENAILPFASLRDAFNDVYRDSFSRTIGSLISDIDAKKTILKQNIASAKTYLDNIRTHLYNLHVYKEISSNRRIIPILTNQEHLTNEDLMSVIGILDRMEQSLQTAVPNIPQFDFIQNNFDLINVPQSPYFNRFPTIDFTIYNSTGNSYGYAHHISHYINAIDQMADTINNGFAGLETIIKNEPNTDQTNTINSIGDIQFLITNICYALLILEYYTGKIGKTIEKCLTEINGYNLTHVLQSIANFINNITTNHTETVKRSRGGITDTTLIESVNNSAGVPTIVITSNNVVEYQNATGIYGCTNLSDSTFSILTVRDPAGTPLATPYTSRQPPGATATRVTTNVDMIRFVQVFDVKKMIENLKNTIDRGSMQGLGNNSPTATNTSNIYNALREMQKQLNAVIDIYNQKNGFYFSEHFNNRMVQETATEPNIEPINNILTTNIKHVEMLPEQYSKFFSKFSPLLFVRTGGITQLPCLAMASELIKSYGFKISDSQTLEVVTNNTGESVRDKTNGVVVGIFSNNPVFGTPKGVHKISTTPMTGQKVSIVNQNLTILRSVFDYHIYFVKLVILMHLVELIANQYVTLLPEDPIKSTIQKILDDITKLTATNPMGLMLAIMGKMIDEIIMSTLDKMSDISAGNYVVFLAKDTIPAVGTTLLVPVVGNLSSERSLLTRPDDRVRLKDAKLLTDVLRSGISAPTPVDVEMLQFFGKTIDSDSDDQFRMINFDSTGRNDDLCYKIDEDVVARLLSAGADPNQSERTGKTPLMMAVYIQNDLIVSTLLRSGAKVMMNGKNVYAFCYDQLIDAIDESPFMCIDEIDQRVESHLLKITGMRHIYSNSRLILRMVAYLFDNQLASNASMYPNMWNRESYQRIIGMLGLQQINMDLIPLAKLDDQLIGENFRGQATYNDTIDELRKQLTDERDLLNRFENAIKEITKDRDMTTGVTGGIVERDESIKEIQEQIKIIEQNIARFEGQLKQLIDSRVLSYDPTKVLAVTTGMKDPTKLISAHKKSRDICTVYEVFFKDVINDKKPIDESDWMVYIKLWQKLLFRPLHEQTVDYTQLVHNLSRNLSNKSDMRDPVMFADAYMDVCDLYEKVFDKYGRDYLELSDYLDKEGTYDNNYNYVLRQMYCIMIHVFKHTISVNLVNTIAHLLVRRDRGTADEQTIKNVYNSMKLSKFVKHCMETVPRQTIKVVCKISEGEKDQDVSLNTTDILNKALDILTLSGYDSIDKNSIVLAKDIVVPIFAQYMETYTAEMHALMVRQIKSMMVQNRWLQILKLLSGKAKLELSR
jgi:hypothetical protein